MLTFIPIRQTFAATCVSSIFLLIGLMLYVPFMCWNIFMNGKCSTSSPNGAGFSSRGAK